MPTKRRLVRIAPLQCERMLGALYGAMGLIFVPFFGILALIGALVPSAANAKDFPGAIVAGIGFAMMILFPLLYAVMGFIIGVVSAAIYNLCAKWLGGIEVEVE